MTSVEMDARGLRDVQRNLERIARELHGDPMVTAMHRAALLVTNEAKRRVPVDTGRLRASITPEIRSQGTQQIIGVVGSNVTYAAVIEVGSRPHWPPLDALEPWASRHHTTPMVVARAIARRGTRAHRYLQGAFEASRAAIQAEIGGAVGGIVRS